MVATGASMLVRVTLRKGRRLYINDGTYGSLFDAGALNWRFPVRLVRPLGRSGKNSNTPNTRLPSEKLVPFVFYGPTCDNLDKMKGPFMLPEDTQEGDWIEIGMLGAYGSTMATRFNGFHSAAPVTVWPEAMPFVTQPARRARVLREVPGPAAEPMQQALSLSAPESRAEEPPAELSADGNADAPALELE
jgi:ornithine decarboxylase